MVLLDDTRGPAAGGTVFHVTDGVTVSPEQRYAFANGVTEGWRLYHGNIYGPGHEPAIDRFKCSRPAAQYNAILLEKGIAPPPPIAPTLRPMSFRSRVEVTAERRRPSQS